MPGVPLEQQDLELLVAIRDILIEPDGRWVHLLSSWQHAICASSQRLY